jgi:hypothetical protein
MLDIADTEGVKDRTTTAIFAQNRNLVIGLNDPKARKRET